MLDPVVKVHIRALLIFITGHAGLSEALEPSIVLLMEAPALSLELVCCKVLLVRVWLEVEGKEQALRIHLAEEHGVVNDF